MSFVDVLVYKNNIAKKEWALPNSFNKNDMKAVVVGLEKEGWEVYDVFVEKQPVFLARKQCMEIYFDNSQAIVCETDYGHCAGKRFNISIGGNYKTNRTPERLWRAGTQKGCGAA